MDKSFINYWVGER